MTMLCKLKAEVTFNVDGKIHVKKFDGEYVDMDMMLCIIKSWLKGNNVVDVVGVDINIVGCELAK